MMGQFSEMVLAGIICVDCGGVANENPIGYPVKCADCKEEQKQKNKQKEGK